METYFKPVPLCSLAVYHETTLVGTTGQGSLWDDPGNLSVGMYGPVDSIRRKFLETSLDEFVARPSVRMLSFEDAAVVGIGLFGSRILKLETPEDGPMKTPIIMVEPNDFLGISPIPHRFSESSSGFNVDYHGMVLMFKSGPVTLGISTMQTPYSSKSYRRIYAGLLELLKETS